MRVAVLLIIAGLCIGCSTTDRWSDAGGTDYLRPTTVEAAEYAVDERVRSLEDELARTRIIAQRLADQVERARDLAQEIKQSSDAVGSISRRSADTIQDTIKQVEILSYWVNWATNRITSLENLLAVDQAFGLKSVGEVDSGQEN